MHLNKLRACKIIAQEICTNIKIFIKNTFLRASEIKRKWYPVKCVATEIILIIITIIYRRCKALLKIVFEKRYSIFFIRFECNVIKNEEYPNEQSLPNYN